MQGGTGGHDVVTRACRGSAPPDGCPRIAPQLRRRSSHAPRLRVVARAAEPAVAQRSANARPSAVPLQRCRRRVRAGARVQRDRQRASDWQRCKRAGIAAASSRPAARSRWNLSAAAAGRGGRRRRMRRGRNGGVAGGGRRAGRGVGQRRAARAGQAVPRSAAAQAGQVAPAAASSPQTRSAAPTGCGPAPASATRGRAAVTGRHAFQLPVPHSCALRLAMRRHDFAPCAAFRPRLVAERVEPCWLPFHRAAARARASPALSIRRSPAHPLSVKKVAARGLRLLPAGAALRHRGRCAKADGNEAEMEKARQAKRLRLALCMGAAGARRRTATSPRSRDYRRVKAPA